MYHLGRQTKRTYWPYVVPAVLAGVLAVGGFWASRQLRPDTTLRQSQPVVRQVTASDTALQHIVTSIFLVDLPPHWRATTAPGAPGATGSWQGVSGDDAARRLDVYVGAVPADLAVNRLLPVSPSGARLEMSGTVSDNCVNFTDKTAKVAASGTAPAKWDGVSFICDMGNYERDVVAIGSDEGINAVTLAGPAAGRQRVLLVYTDNNVSPDYSIFTAIVRSFRLR